MGKAEIYTIVEDIFNRALTLSSEKRDEFILVESRNATRKISFSKSFKNNFSKKPSKPEDLIYREVKTLLRALESPPDVLNEPVFPLFAKTLDESVTGLLLKKNFAGFELKALLGRGGMGAVFLARDLNLDRSVAIKILPLLSFQSAATILQFKREAVAASSISHPGITHIYEFGEFEGIYFIVMEYIAGTSLRERLKSDPPDLMEAVDLMIQLADILSEVHDRSIIHRDIKPENIMITQKGHLKLLDFGLAVWLQETSEANLPPQNKNIDRSLKDTVNGFIGTTAYLSPEFILGQKVHNATDLWSLGVVFYELITKGIRPFGGETKKQLRHSITADSFEIPEEIANIPELEDLINRLLEKDPGKRIADIDVLTEKLRAIRRKVYDLKYNY